MLAIHCASNTNQKGQNDTKKFSKATNPNDVSGLNQSGYGSSSMVRVPQTDYVPLETTTTTQEQKEEQEQTFVGIEGVITESMKNITTKNDLENQNMKVIIENQDGELLHTSIKFEEDDNNKEENYNGNFSKKETYNIPEQAKYNIDNSAEYQEQEELNPNTNNNQQANQNTWNNSENIQQRKSKEEFEEGAKSSFTAPSKLEEKNNNEYHGRYNTEASENYNETNETNETTEKNGISKWAKRAGVAGVAAGGVVLAAVVFRGNSETFKTNEEQGTLINEQPGDNGSVKTTEKSDLDTKKTKV